MKTLVDPKNILADDIIEMSLITDNKFSWHIKCGYNLFTNFVFSADYEKLRYITCYLCKSQLYILKDINDYSFYLHKSIII